MKTRSVLITVMASSIVVSLGIFFGLWFVSGGLSDKGRKGITVTGSAQVEAIVIQPVTLSLKSVT